MKCSPVRWIHKVTVHKGANHVPKADFGSAWSASWLGSWFELHYVRSQRIATAVPITNRMCTLRGNSVVPTAQIDPCMASACISKMCMQESRSERALRSQRVKSGFLGGSRSKTPFGFRILKPDLKELCIHKGQNQERVRTTIRNGFRNVIHSFVNRPKVLRP